MTTDLAARLREATRNAHRNVEHSRFMRAFLRGQFDRAAYCTLLSNLHGIYAALEAGLERHRDDAALGRIDLRELRRAPAIEADLLALHGESWRHDLPRSATADAYVAHIDSLARTAPALLAAHAYVRYLGDLNGGRVLRRIVAQTLGLEGSAALRFYDFGSGDNESRLSNRFRDALNAIALTPDIDTALHAEALDGFARHAAMFEEIAPVLGAGVAA